MKTKFTFSLILASLLLTPSVILASSLNDNVTSQKVDTKSHTVAKEKIKLTNSEEALLAKTKKRDFQKEANQDETKRLSTVVDKEMKNHKNSLDKIPQEFMSGINDTIQALQAIHANNTKEAEKLLESADKKFQTALEKSPELNLIPVTDNAEIISFNGDAKLIKDIKDLAVKLLKDNDIQVAIELLKPLQDEMIITTQYVPAILYPDAVKEALKDLKANKNDIALQTLVDTLNTIQVDTLIIPIPLITAQNMVLEASKLKKSDKKEALALLNQAQDELEKARLLGYTHKNEQSYKDITKEIENIKTEIKGKNIVVKLYDKLLQSFKNLDDKHIADVQHAK